MPHVKTPAGMPLPSEADMLATLLEIDPDPVDKWRQTYGPRFVRAIIPAMVCSLHEGRLPADPEQRAEAIGVALARLAADPDLLSKMAQPVGLAVPAGTLSDDDRAEAAAALETLAAILALLPPPAWADTLQAAAETLRQRLHDMLASGSVDEAALHAAAFLDKVHEVIQDAVQADTNAVAVQDYLEG